MPSSISLAFTFTGDWIDGTDMQRVVTFWRKVWVILFPLSCGRNIPTVKSGGKVLVYSRASKK